MKTLPLKIILLVAALWLPLSAHAAKNILVFGDSLSAGYGIAVAESWPALLQQELARSHPDYRVVNASISGETTQGGRQRIAEALRQLEQAECFAWRQLLQAEEALRAAIPTPVRKLLGELLKNPP